MSTPNPNERLLRFLQATPEQQAAIDRILAGELPAAAKAATGPLLLGMGNAARLLGVSRVTLWRMLKAGRLARVEVLPGSYRVRRAEIEAIAGGESAPRQQSVSSHTTLTGPSDTLSRTRGRGASEGATVDGGTAR